MENYSTQVSDFEIEKGEADIYGVVYSPDGKRLLKCQNTQLSEYSIKDGTVVICADAFRDCKVLKNIYMPDSVTSIAGSAFVGCNNLTITRKAKSVSEMPDSDFEFEVTDKVNLMVAVTRYNGEDEAIEIPQPAVVNGVECSVTGIGRSAFENCIGLKSVVIPSSLEKIEWDVFSDCTSLESVVIPEGVTTIKSRAFNGCKSLKSVGISEGVTTIENAVFEDCDSLTSVTFPKSLTEIGEKVFADCDSLTSVEFAESGPEIDPSAFIGCPNLKEWKVVKKNPKLQVQGPLLMT